MAVTPLEVEVRVADLPQVKAALARASEEIAALRALLQAWEPRLRCLQCGERYSERSCGPEHAIVRARLGASTFCEHRLADVTNRGRKCPDCGLQMLYFPTHN
jgi:hypothetical protein